jgi:hypothetical protein
MMKGNSEMIALVLAFKRINIFRSGEKKFSVKGSDNFTGVLNSLAGSVGAALVFSPRAIFYV